MITISWKLLITGFLAFCAGFSCICVAVGWVIKIVKAVRQPTKDIHAEIADVNRKLDNDNKRIKVLEEQFGFVLKAISLLLQDDLAILEHLRTSNNTGEMAKQEKKVKQFLTER